jgi:hypothetical protein
MPRAAGAGDEANRSSEKQRDATLDKSFQPRRFDPFILNIWAALVIFVE